MVEFDTAHIVNMEEPERFTRMLLELRRRDLLLKRYADEDGVECRRDHFGRRRRRKPCRPRCRCGRCGPSRYAADTECDRSKCGAVVHGNG